MHTHEPIEISVLRWAPPFVHGLVRDLRVRWALEEAGLPYRVRKLSAEEQASADYRALQPFGQVPAFRHGDLTLFESGAIVLHIAEQSEALMPREADGRSQVQTWVFCALNSVEPPVMMLSMIDLTYQGPKGDETRSLRQTVVQFISSRLDAVARVLEGKEHLLGRFTAADILMTSVLRNLGHTDLVRERPVLAAYQRRCEERPAFRKALADHMASFIPPPA